MASIAWNPLEDHWDVPLAPALFNTPKGCVEGDLVFNYVHEEKSVQIFDCQNPDPPSVFEAGLPVLPDGRYQAYVVAPAIPQPLKGILPASPASSGGTPVFGGISVGSTSGKNPVSEEIVCCDDVPVAVVPLPSSVTLLALPVVLILILFQIARRKREAIC